MLQEICVKSSEVVLSVLVSETEIQDGAICRPQQYFQTIHRLLSGSLGVVAHHNLTGDNSQAIEHVFERLEAVLSSECSFVQNFKRTSNAEKQALQSFSDWFQKQTFENVNLSDLYELMLSLEFPIKDGDITEDFENEILNTIGSFYTPKDLADKCVELTLDNYIFQNTAIERFSASTKTEEQNEAVAHLLLSSSYADQSCGTGSFLLAILRYIQSNFSDNGLQIQEQIVFNMTAIEADAIALEIAKIEILSAIKKLNYYAEINQNFTHGNPILSPFESESNFEFSNEFYYQNALAIEPENLSKCDVIVGNPPWGTVAFDLAFACHIILPQMNQVENQEQLEQLLAPLESTHPHLFDWLLEHEEENDLALEAIYEDERFLNSTMGGLHTNVLFTELTNRLLTDRGSAGLILKGSTLTDSNNKRLLKLLQANKRMVARYDFSNVNQIFNIDSDEHFSIAVLGNSVQKEPTHRTGLTRLSDIN